MRPLESYKNPIIGLICLIVVFLSISGLFIFLFVNCISLYSKFDIEYSDLICEELTFSKYEKLDGYKTDKKYIVYFEEYEKPFEISTISDIKLDKYALAGLTKGESIKVYYKEAFSKKYDYEICEFSHNSVVLLSLSDYVETNQNNQVAGMIVNPIIAIMGLVLVGLFVYGWKKGLIVTKLQNSKL